MAKTATAHKANEVDTNKEHEMDTTTTPPVHDDNAAASAAAYAAAPKEIEGKLGDETTPDAVYLTDTAELGGVTVNLTSDIYVGMPLSAADARVLLTARVRQFKNNQDANAKARAERYAKATNDAERAENAPWTAEQYAAAFVGYRPSVGDTPRQSAIEKLRYEAAGLAYDEMVAEHNAVFSAALKAANGQPLAFPLAGSPMPKARSYIVQAERPKKARGADDTAHKAAVAQWEERRKALLTKLLASPDYAARIQAKLDALSKPKAVPAPVTNVPVQQADDIDII